MFDHIRESMSGSTLKRNKKAPGTEQPPPPAYNDGSPAGYTATHTMERSKSLPYGAIGYQYEPNAQNFAVPKPQVLKKGPSREEGTAAAELPTYRDASAETEEQKKQKEAQAMLAYFVEQREQAKQNRDPALTFSQM